MSTVLELTREQQLALLSTPEPVTVDIPEAKRTFVVIEKETYDRLQSLLEVDEVDRSLFEFDEIDPPPTK